MIRQIILGDWGTTRLRVYRFAESGAVERLEGPGIGRLKHSAEETLLATLAPWREGRSALSIVLCGMAGSRNGVIEAPYAACPARADDWASNFASAKVAQSDISVAPGLSCRNPVGAPDVMRGEETQIFGAMRREPSLFAGRHVVVLPGTHSKWAVLEDGAVLRFHTFVTGELFAVLRDHSLLIGPGAIMVDERDAGFEAGLARIAAGRGALAHMFEARSAQIIGGRSRSWGLGFLSAVLIGSEIADGLALFDNPRSLTLVGDPALTSLYTRLLRVRELAVRELDGDACSIAGLAVLRDVVFGGQ